MLTSLSEFASPCPPTSSA